MKQGRKSFRLKFTFWLDDMRPDESDLITYIEELKAQRKFVTTIKQGLRLMRDLREGGVDVLFELFPHLKSRLAGPSDNSELLTLISGLMSSQTAATMPSLPPMVKVAAVEVSSEDRKKLSIANTLAALEDF